MPHLALPSLAAYLRANGIEVIQRDLNVDIFDHLLSARQLQTTLRQLRRERKRIEHQGLTPALQQAKLEAFDWASAHGKELATSVDQAKETVRSPGFFDPQVGLQAFLTVTDALRLASVPYYPSELRLTGYDSAYPPDASTAIRAAIQDRHLNLFRAWLQASVLPQIRREQPDVIGISLTSADQVIAAFTLAALIKEAGLPSHVVLGGKMITCWRDQLPGLTSLWDLFDSAIVFEGEVALLQLVRALEQGADLASVPNLMYHDGSDVHINDFKAPEPASTLPVPDFDGLPLDLYLVPARVLPVSACRGCYWGRCAFCNVGYGESCTFSERKGEQVAAEMLAQSERYDTQHFFFADEALSPRMLRALSSCLIESGARLKWTCCARFEPGISSGLLHDMRRAGCRMVLYGLESGSQEVLDRMHKGTRLEIAERILREGAEAGIWNHIFFFFGFPGESEEQAQETIQFFYRNRDAVHSVCTGTFLFERHAQVARDPQAYGISRILPRPARDLAYYDEYETVGGVSASRAEQIEAQFIDRLPIKPVPHLYFHDIYRFLYASRFADSEPLPTMLG